jgi:Transposase IS116/IS110/IS902 family
MQNKRRLWSQAGQKLLPELPLPPWAACRRADLLGPRTMLEEQIGKLDRAVQQAAEEHPQAKLLLTQPGVGPNTALAFVLTTGDASRFRRGKQVASHLVLIHARKARGDGRSWARSRSRATGWCVVCWWQRRRPACVSIPDFASSTGIAVSRSQKVWRRWQRRAGWPYDSTGCCALRWRIRRSFASRAARGCPGSAQARPLN